MNPPAWRNFDPLLLVAALGLTTLGALVIYSAALPRGAEGIVITEPVFRHIGSAIAGALLMFFAARFDYRLLDVVGWILYAVGVGLLVLVLIFGTSQFGSRRWFDLGFVVVQVSEIAKLTTIIALAKFFADYRERIQEWRVFVASLAIVGLPALLVFAEPDAGSTVVFFIFWFVMALFAGASLKHFAVLTVVVLALVPLAATMGVQDYQRDRIRVFIDPAEDPLGVGFNVLQAETSVGAGGLFGKGLTKGTQTQLDFLQTQTTDFIFSVLGEELGFVGAMTLFALFLLLLTRGVRAITRATDPLGQTLIAGIVALIAVQAFVNIGVNIRLMPVTGLPLPFISVGNSSLIVLFGALGLIQSILIHREEYRSPFAQSM